MFIRKRLLFVAFLMIAIGNIASWAQAKSETQYKSKFIKIDWFLGQRDGQNDLPRDWQQSCKKILSLLWQLKECNPKKIEMLIETRSFLNGSSILSKLCLEKEDLDNFNLTKFNSISPELENPTRLNYLGLEVAIACDSKILKKIYNCMISFDENISTIKNKRDCNLLMRINNKFPFAIDEEKKK